jgi:MurNAc alpha-1-phosphate uridylyltransferase
MSVKPSKAMVLAAGLGLRMRPLTDHMPKPLVRVAGRPLLDHVLDKLTDAGVTDAVVNVHYLPDQIIAHVASRSKPRVIISDERNQVLGTGGGVVKALSVLGDAPFFHVNSDTMWIDGVQSNLKRLAEAFDPKRMRAASVMAGAATTPCCPMARCASAGSIRSCRSSMQVPRSCRRRFSPARPRANFR